MFLLYSPLNSIVTKSLVNIVLDIDLILIFLIESPYKNYQIQKYIMSTRYLWEHYKLFISIYKCNHKYLATTPLQLEWFAKTRESHFRVLHFTTLFCQHFPLCFRCMSLYYTLAITLCFAGFCKRLYYYTTYYTLMIEDY